MVNTRGRATSMLNVHSSWSSKIIVVIQCTSRCLHWLRHLGDQLNAKMVTGERDVIKLVESEPQSLTSLERSLPDFKLSKDFRMILALIGLNHVTYDKV